MLQLGGLEVNVVVQVLGGGRGRGRGRGRDAAGTSAGRQRSGKGGGIALQAVVAVVAVGGIVVVMRVVLCLLLVLKWVVVVRVVVIVGQGVLAVGAYQQWSARAAAMGRRVCGRKCRARLGDVMREGNGRRGLRQRDF